MHLIDVGVWVRCEWSCEGFWRTRIVQKPVVRNHGNKGYPPYYTVFQEMPCILIWHSLRPWFPPRNITKYIKVVTQVPCFETCTNKYHTLHQRESLPRATLWTTITTFQLSLLRTKFQTSYHMVFAPNNLIPPTLQQEFHNQDTIP